MADFLAFRQASRLVLRPSSRHKCERRPGLAKPGDALKFACSAQILCLCLLAPAFGVFPAAQGRLCVLVGQFWLFPWSLRQERRGLVCLASGEA